MQQLIKSIKAHIVVNADFQEALEAAFQLEEVPKKHQFLRAKQYARKLYFLEQGVIRTFYYNKEKDISSWFYQSGQFFTSWHSFFSQNASFEYIEALSPTQVYAISYQDYQQILAAFPPFERFGRLMVEQYMVFLDQYSKGYMFLSAKERYALLLNYFPQIELYVKLGHIASFLGISQETLSRIRSGK